MKSGSSNMTTRRLIVCGKEYAAAKITSGASEPEGYAAEELREYLGKIGIPEGDGALFDIELDGSLKRDSYVIVPGEGGEINIRGGNGRGVIYGVYAFLEKYAGMRFFLPGLEKIGSGDITVNESCSFTAALDMRQSDWQCGNNDVDWCVKNGINMRSIPERMGGEISYGGGFVHTMAALAGIAPTEQPCFSDPEVLRKTIDSVKEILKKDPNVNIISVSQNDNPNYCTCEKCVKIDAEERSHMGSLLRFVNAVAEEIEKDYPDVVIETLAYVYTRNAPKITKPRGNVAIRLCSIECCFCHPINDMNCEQNKAFCEDLRDWSGICGRIYIWDYTTSFWFYVQTFPNFGVLRENMRFFAENHVKGIYPEGNYNSAQSGEFGELRCYLLAKLMMDPYMSGEEYSKLMNEFLAAYYGEGWENIRAYIDWFTEKAAENGHMGIFAPIVEVIGKESIREMTEVFDGYWNKAEELAGDRIEAVRRSRLQWDCVKLMLDPDAALADRFVERLKEHNIMWSEWCILPPNYSAEKTADTWVM